MKYEIKFAGKTINTAPTLKNAEQYLRMAAQAWRAGDLLQRQRSARSGYTAVRWDRGERGHRGAGPISYELKERRVFAGYLTIEAAA